MSTGFFLGILIQDNLKTFCSKLARMYIKQVQPLFTKEFRDNKTISLVIDLSFGGQGIRLPQVTKSKLINDLCCFAQSSLTAHILMGQCFNIHNVGNLVIHYM